MSDPVTPRDAAGRVQLNAIPGVSRADDPTADVLTADVLTADVLTADVLTADDPTADVPAADVPAADVPAADVPAADVPKTLIVSDLDRTLIYSARAAAAPLGALLAVERYRDADASFLTRAAADILARLPLPLVPATTRTLEQFRRITLPGPPAPWAVAANGGLLLADGRPDEAWTARVRARLRTVAALDEVHAHAVATCRPEWTHSVRTAEDMFCYAVLDRAGVPDGFVAETTDWAGQRGWQVSLQGRKLYWMPRPLTKSAAVAEIARRAGADRVLAAGDSLLDADLLAGADEAMMARHGELYESGWTASHVRVTSELGAAAGEEIVRWFSSAVAGTDPNRRGPARPARPRPERTAAG